MILKQGMRGPEVKALQQKLVKAGYSLSVDGIFGPHTAHIIQTFQYQSNLATDAIAGPNTLNALNRAIRPSDLGIDSDAKQRDPKILALQDYEFAAEYLGLSLPLIKAVAEVESRGSGFLPGGDPIILFEGHVFYRELSSAGVDPVPLSKEHPDIIYSGWTKKHYQGGQAEHERLARAKAIHEEAALKSASWGMFQIMGFNYPYCGTKSVQEYVAEVRESARRQLMHFCCFLEYHNLHRSLKRQDWHAFARGYNGPAYKKNDYHNKLANAYQKHLKAAG